MATIGDYAVGQLYYMVVKKYELPVRNHTHVKKKIADLGREIPEDHAKHYLAALLRRDLRTEPYEYKPVLAEALDIYIKRVKIEDYFRRNKPSITGRVAHQIAEHEAKRARQWAD